MTADTKSKGVKADISFLSRMRVMAHKPKKPAASLVRICRYSIYNPPYGILTAGYRLPMQSINRSGGAKIRKTGKRRTYEPILLSCIPGAAALRNQRS
ncbi:hypothetical protein D3C75_991430 [compost metagenome]